MNRIERIVVGTDFSEAGEHAVDHAVDLAAQVGATLILVHAYELPAYSLPDGVIVATPEVAAAVTTAGLDRLAASIERRKDRGVPLRSKLRMGAPWDELNAVAEEERADLIVVGTHGRRGFSRLMLGSVAERIVRTAVRPVMVVHGEAAASRGAAA